MIVGVAESPEPEMAIVGRISFRRHRADTAWLNRNRQTIQNIGRHTYTKLIIILLILC